MTLLTTTQASIVPLTLAQKRVGQHLVDGHPLSKTATQTGLAPVTVRRYVRNIRENLHCPPRCKPPVIVHALFVNRQIDPPTTDVPAPELSDADQLLLQAITMHSHPVAIAAAIETTPYRAQSSLVGLLAKTGAIGTTQLVVLGHAWGLLGSTPVRSEADA